jgi:ABC-type lipoprotein release transport system permease subunit
MRKRYILKLALRNIISHRLRSVLTIMGITIGVGFIIFLISLGYGLQRISTQEIANLEALQVLDVTPGKSKIIEVNDEAITKFNNLSNVVASAPQISVVGKISYESSTSEGVIYGKNLDFLQMEEAQLETGAIYRGNNDKEALVNITALKQLGIKDYPSIVGQMINIKVTITPELSKNDAPIVKEDEFKVVGVLKNESSPYIYIPLDVFKGYGVVKYSSAKTIPIWPRPSLKMWGIRRQRLKIRLIK